MLTSDSEITEALCEIEDSTQGIRIKVMPPLISLNAFRQAKELADKLKDTLIEYRVQLIKHGNLSPANRSELLISVDRLVSILTMNENGFPYGRVTFSEFAIELQVFLINLERFYSRIEKDKVIDFSKELGFDLPDSESQLQDSAKKIRQRCNRRHSANQIRHCQ